MMLFGPLLIACIPGICILLITWWLSKKSVSLFVKLFTGAYNNSHCDCAVLHWI